MGAESFVGNPVLDLIAHWSVARQGYLEVGDPREQGLSDVEKGVRALFRRATETLRTTRSSASRSSDERSDAASSGLAGVNT